MINPKQLSFLNKSMEATLSQITGANGKLLPSRTVSAHKKAPVLNIITSSSPEEPVDLPEYSSDDSNGSDESFSSESPDGFYVELSLSCTNEDGDGEGHSAIFNFGSESNYMEHAEGGFEDFDTYFEDAINVNYPGWSYADEWEELEIHGSELPEDHDGAIVDID